MALHNVFIKEDEKNREFESGTSQAGGDKGGGGEEGGGEEGEEEGGGEEEKGDEKEEAEGEEEGGVASRRGWSSCISGTSDQRLSSSFGKITLFNDTVFGQ